jgi:hypothetical protein
MRGEARQWMNLETTPEDEVFFEPRGAGVIKEGEDPVSANTTTAPPKGLGSVADIDRYLNSLEEQMKSFDAKG